MQTPASAGVVLNYAHVAQARTLSSMHALMFGLHAACILQVSHSNWLKWQNHNFFVLCLTRLRRQKKNEPGYTHDSRSADQLAAAQRRPGPGTRQAAAFAIFSLRNRAAGRGPIQMYVLPNLTPPRIWPPPVKSGKRGLSDLASPCQIRQTASA